MFEFLEKYLMGPMTKLSQLKLVRAITAAGMATIPFTIVGSMFLVFNVLPRVITPLQGIYDSTFSKVSDLYMLANTASMGIIAIYFLIIIAYEYTKITADEDNLDLSPISGVLLSIFGFIIMIPQFTNNEGIKLLQDAENNIINGWAMGGAPSRFGAVGIFTAIIVSFICVKIYEICVKKHIVIKMPDAVPPGVANSFTALIPAFFVAILLIITNGIMISFGTDIFEVISIPFGFVANISGTWLGLILIFFLTNALWIVGIHGTTVINSMVLPMLLFNMDQNVNGAAIPYAAGFNKAYVDIGGSGGTLGLVIMLAFFAKSEQFKVLGRASVIPSIFNINEPVIFGLPIVYNPYFAIPFILSPMITGTITYFAIKLEMVKPLIAQQPWPTPVGLGAFIGSGGDWKAGVLAIICAIVSALIYYPFFKKRDYDLYKEETQSL
ncbi:PTS cellobiose transporter subunit IIC [uncultured Anaerococcus sp.]|uniref:PTS cellobiose transporter subunit IIC n=1 Tax=uncultured Anaerococcus sp. TaxID=293428 RepID=UPI00288AE71B|nr:PTS cellobiose transporter subunit IIC [uncultured Anaerococcus sp.]